jgi:hypothetical protein
VSQHRAELHEEIEMKWAQKVADTKLRKKADPAQKNMDTTGSSTRHNRQSLVEQIGMPMEGITMDVATRLTIEEFSDELASSCGGGLDQSWHAPEPTTVESPTATNGPDAGQHAGIGGISRDPPTGPKVWRERVAKNQRQSKRSKPPQKDVAVGNTKLQQLEAEILTIKEKIWQKKNVNKQRTKHSGNRDEADGWKVVRKKGVSHANTQSLKINGKYRLIIRSSVDGTRLYATNIQKETSESAGY